VAAIARALGLSQRTLQRRFRADGLPGPKALLDWLTLAYLRHVSQAQQRSVARVAAELALAPNDLYRLRKRVLRRAVPIGMERLAMQTPAAASRAVATTSTHVTAERRAASPLYGRVAVT
jgi:hypothetical protein